MVQSKMNKTKAIIVFGLILMFVACVPPSASTTLVKHQQQLNMWKGKNVGMLFGMYGKPDRTEVVGDYYVIYYSLVKQVLFGDRKCEITFSKEKEGNTIIATGITSSSGDTYANIDPCYDLIKAPPE